MYNRVFVKKKSLTTIQLSRGEGWDPINRFNPATFVYMSGSGFPTSYVVVCFVFSELRWEVIARFVDIGGIGDNHCLNFLFIIAFFLVW